MHTRDGRKEKRSPREFEVLLSAGEEPIFSELASAENASSYGVRVRTARAWKPDTPILVKSAQRKWVRARVVYCQTLHSKSFALGIEFHTRQLD